MIKLAAATMGSVGTMFATVNPADLAYVLSAALAAAIGGGAVAWRRLQVLGSAERDKLIAEKNNIVERAEDRATKRSLEALEAALGATCEERDYLRASLDETRNELKVATTHIAELTERLIVLEAQMDHRRVDSPPRKGGRRSTDPD